MERATREVQTLGEIDERVEPKHRGKEKKKDLGLRLRMDLVPVL